MNSPYNAIPRIITIDCNYIDKERAAAYLLLTNDSAAFVDTNTTKAVPLLLAALQKNGHKPENVQYIIITHVHLDHSGGTAALLKACPNATIIAHPRAVRHLVNPTRLVESAKGVYGENRFNDLYGAVEPVPENRIKPIEDNSQIEFGDQTLLFLHTPGHARHHIIVFEPKTKTTFTGDTFGVGLARLYGDKPPFLLCSTAPTEFEPDQARITLKRIMELGTQKVALAHFGIIDNAIEAARSLEESILQMEKILFDLLSEDLTNLDAIKNQCEKRIRQTIQEGFHKLGIHPSPQELEWFQGDIRMNALGLIYAAQRLKKQNP